MKFPHKKARVNEDKLYEEKTFDRDYEEDQKRYRKRMKEIEKSRRSSFDMMEEAENDEYFELENVIGPGYEIREVMDKRSLKEVLIEFIEKLSKLQNNASCELKEKLDKKEILSIFKLTIGEGILFGGNISLISVVVEGEINQKSNIIFGLVSLLIIAGLYPVNKMAYVKDKKKGIAIYNKIDCANELLDLNGKYYDASEEELEINVMKVK